MRNSKLDFRGANGMVSALSICMASAMAVPAHAQSTEETPPAPAPAEAETESEIVVSGSRIERAGFDAPTPTTVIGAIELRQGSRPSIAAVVNDLPQFRPTLSPTTTTGNTSSTSVALDLRGLQPVRTLTLLNGRRFTGSADLNNIPMSLVKQIEVVTGGASAAWGSGAVAGVVNILLNDDFEGVEIGANAGVSSRGDAPRYGFDIAAGTDFAGGRGHVMIAGSYLEENGAFNRNSGSRPTLDSNLFVNAAGQVLLASDVNSTNSIPGGVVTSGIFSGNVFNPDGTLSPFPFGSVTSGNNTIGGGGRSQFDYQAVSAPYQRATMFARATYEISDAARLWVDFSYGQMKSDFGFFPESAAASATAGGVVIQADNAYLRPELRAQLAGAGQTSFRLGRMFDDIGPKQYLYYRYKRKNIEGAVGIDGEIGGWRYSAHYAHGELDNLQSIENQRIVANFNQAIDAVFDAGGNIVCRAALANPTTACRPLNLLGSGNASPEAVAYAFGDAVSRTVTKLDTGGISLRGDLFSTWAGPVSIAIGAEARKEAVEIGDIDALSTARALSTVNFSPLKGSFSVKEGFAEAVVPLLKTEMATLEINGAARYSDYSTSGGIWSWKIGGTSRLFDSLLLRAVRSRDIRSPSVAELFTTRTTNLGQVSDPFRNNEVVNVFRFGGGNPALVPEIAHTTTIGASFTPKFVPGLRLSVDLYKINIDKVIGGLSAQDIVTLCFNGNDALCSQIERDAAGQLVSVSAVNLNLANYRTRGIDFEAAYVTPLEELDGRLRLRALATYVDTLKINDGINTYDRAGVVGDGIAFSTPHWRGTGSVTLELPGASVDLRARYVGGGIFNEQVPIVNNDIKSRTYVDLGFEFPVNKQFTFSASVVNLFDRDPPFVLFGSANYDMLGRFFSVSAKARF